MKAQYQIVGNKQFEYIMLEREVESTEEAVEAYSALVEAYKPSGEGLTSQEVNGILDGWFAGRGIDSNLYDKRNPEQDKWFQAIKRSLARVKRNSNGEDID